MASRATTILLAAVATMPPSLGQQPPPVEELLASRDPAAVARGAWHAAETGDEAWTPLVLRARAENEDRGSARWSLARRVLVDALLALDAEVPPVELARIGRRHPTEALLLAARDPRRYEEALLAIRDQRLAGPEWTLAHALLVEARSPRIAAPLLAELELELVVTVVDAASRAGAGRGGILGGRACGRLEVPPDFPPLRRHVLSERGDGEAVVARPFRVVHRVETVAPGTTSGIGRAEPRHDRDARRLAFLAALLGEETLPVAARRDRALRWGADCGRDELLATHDDLVADVAALVRALLARGLLERQAVPALVPDIETTVRDARDDRSTPLPALDGLESHRAALWARTAVRISRSSGRSGW